MTGYKKNKMSKPHEPQPVKFFLGLIYSPLVSLWDLEREIQKEFDFVDQKSPVLDFIQFTDYYVDEMGPLLYRTWWSLHRLWPPEQLVEFKHLANRLEDKFKAGDPGAGRSVNIDPGYLNESRLVLASGKDFSHRLYLGQGVYGEITLIYQHDGFQPLAWTYPDYRCPEALHFFQGVRGDYRKQLTAAR